MLKPHGAACARNGGKPLRLLVIDIVEKGHTNIVVRK
jgi:hypothetical protein